MLKLRSLALGLSVVVILLSAFVLTTQHTNAAAYENSSTSTSFPLKGCMITHVTLHGVLSPSVTCLKSRTASRNVIPNTGVTVCRGSYNMSIEGDQGTVCFSGTGYMAIHLTHIYFAYAGQAGWLRLYPSGSTEGFYFNIDGNVFDYPIDGAHDMTQICDQCGFH